MNKEDKNSLVTLRLQRAGETMIEVKDIVELKHWRVAANRLYYACYYAVSALLIDNNLTAHTHAGMINQLGLHFVTKGIISQEQGKLYKQLFELRQSSDYDDWITIGESDVQPLIEPAEQFISEIEKLITTKTILKQ